MKKKPYLHILEKEDGMKYASFYLYLPANDLDEEVDSYYVKYRFVYVNKPFDSSLSYENGPNNPSNCNLYRIKKAYIVKKVGDEFIEQFRALSGGEIVLAFREQGAGDFVGGVHGDELLQDIFLKVDGEQISLNKPFFGSFNSFEFYMKSKMNRCNTPDMELAIHTQYFYIEEQKLCLKQNIEWLNDTYPMQAVYTPMLTAQRLNPDNSDEILSDTVEFYSPENDLIRVFDTTDYGASADDGRTWDIVCEGTKATKVRVYGKNSGFSAEVGYEICEKSIPMKYVNTSLCIRYMKRTVDNKIYFDISGGAAAKKGMCWKSNIYYTISYKKQ